MGFVLSFVLLESDELKKNVLDTKARRRLPLQQDKAKHSSLSCSLPSCLSLGTSSAFKKSSKMCNWAFPSRLLEAAVWGAVDLES